MQTTKLDLENQGFDSTGRPIVDPTKNVLQLVEAAVKRLDDLASAEKMRVDMQFTYMEKLQTAEAKRIDAIRAVDVNAVAVASERAAAQAQVLANQVSQSAETLRSLVAQTASTIAQQLAQLTSQLTDRLALLEKSQYENKGREIVSNPVEAARIEAVTTSLSSLQKEISGLRESRSEGTGGKAGVQHVWGYVVGAIGLATGIVSFLLQFKK